MKNSKSKILWSIAGATLLTCVGGCHRTADGNTTDPAAEQSFQGTSSDEPDCGSVEAQKLVTDVAKEHLALLSFIQINGKGPTEPDPEFERMGTDVGKLEGKLTALEQQCPILAESTNQQIDKNCAIQFGTSNAEALALRAEIDSLNKQIDELKGRKSNLKYEKVDTAFKQAAQNVRYQLATMIMTDKNDQTGAVQCKASLGADVPDWGAASVDITYKIETTTDGQLFATVYGL